MLTLSLAVAAVLPSTALADTYLVTSPGDGPVAPCRPSTTGVTTFECDTLRSAVAAAGGSGDHQVFLPSGTYAVSQGQIALTGSVAVFGANARSVTVQNTGATRVFNVPPGASPALYGMTITGGTTSGTGGNILNQGHLSLTNVRVTGGSATTGGGGIANAGGDLTAIYSLIDTNRVVDGFGGGIFNDGAAGPATLTLLDTTIALNDSLGPAGIRSSGNGGNTVALTSVTIARNNGHGSNPGGVGIESGTAGATGSIIAANAGDTADCIGPITNNGGNLAADSSCGFPPSANLQIDTALRSDLGGHTPVLAIAAGSQAKGFANPCPMPVDQRLATRPFPGACDAGAFQEGVAAPAVSDYAPPSVATPTPTPTPVPTPTPAPPPTPQAQKSITGTVVDGTIMVRVPGGKFVLLDPTKPIPVGSTIDSRNGEIRITALLTPGGPLQSARFFDGVFRITQTKTTTNLALTEALAACKKGKASAAAKKKPKTRKLWGDGSGSFRTQGQYSAATVRGTEWLVQDSCAGTLTRVKHGVVSVRDNVRHRTIILRAGKHYLARP